MDLEEERKLSAADGERLAARHGNLPFYEVSSKEGKPLRLCPILYLPHPPPQTILIGTNVEEAFMKMIDIIFADQANMPPAIHQSIKDRSSLNVSSGGTSSANNSKGCPCG